MKITQRMLDLKIEELQKLSKCKIITNNPYSYFQLAIKLNHGISMFGSTLGNTKKDLFYQIQFLIDWLKHEDDHKKGLNEN